jgi:hypothetical protein
MTRLTVIFLAGLLIGPALAGCTKVVDKGTYGPFRIGESKIEALQQARKLGVHLTPVVPEPIYIKNPDTDGLVRLNSSNGILVWLGEHPWPLRIEFTKGHVSAVWPKFPQSSRAPESMQAIESELARLSSMIRVGSTRSYTYKVLLGFRSAYRLDVGTFVVGYQRFVVANRFAGPDYDAMLLQNSAWTFDGLKNMVWFKPFYSRVTLYFKDGKLSSIHHWRFPVELP